MDRHSQRSTCTECAHEPLFSSPRKQRVKTPSIVEAELYSLAPEISQRPVLKEVMEFLTNYQVVRHVHYDSRAARSNKTIWFGKSYEHMDMTVLWDKR